MHMVSLNILRAQTEENKQPKEIALIFWCTSVFYMSTTSI